MSPKGVSVPQLRVSPQMPLRHDWLGLFHGGVLPQKTLFHGNAQGSRRAASIFDRS